MTLAAILSTGTIALLMFERVTRDQLTYYPDWRDVEAAQANARSWVPRFIPSGSFDYHEYHEYDSELLAGQLRVLPSEAQSVLSGLSQIDGRGYVDIPRTPIPSWIVTTDSKVSCAELRKHGFTIMTSEIGGSPAVVLFERSAGRLIYWAPYWRPPCKK